MKTLLQRVVCLSVALLTAHSHAAFDAFLKIEGVDGESKSNGRSNWVDVVVLTNGFPTIGGAGAGLIIRKRVDKASPKLFERCASGTVLPDMRLELVENPPFENPTNQVRFFDIRLSNIVVTAFSNAGQSSAPEDVPMESFSLNYEKITWTYTTRRPGSQLPRELLSTSVNLATGGVTGATNAASFTMTGIRKLGGEVELQWQGVAGRIYDVYSCATLTGPFSLRGQTTAAADGPMTHTATILPGTMFLVVEERP